MNEILVVEDDLAMADLYDSVLSQAGYQVFQAHDGLQALDILETEYISLIITDIMMPNMDGYEFTQALRDAKYEMPVIMITAKDTINDKKHGFRIGIDDYMVKPIDLEEMVLRVEAVLRRAKIASQNQLTVGQTHLDYDSLTISWPNHSQVLPQKEFQLIFKLLSYPNRIFTRLELMDEFWGLESQTDIRTIDVHIKRLRDRLKDNNDFNIVTVRGLGYKAEINDYEED